MPPRSKRGLALARYRENKKKQSGETVKAPTKTESSPVAKPVKTESAPVAKPKLTRMEVMEVARAAKKEKREKRRARMAHLFERIKAAKESLSSSIDIDVVTVKDELPTLHDAHE